MRIAVADFVTNTCFPLLAAEELEFFKAEGLDAQVELITPATKAISALREGATDAYAGGSVHAVLKSFPGWKGVKLIAALSQGIPWLLVVRADLHAERGDMNALKGLRIGADQEPDAALKQLLIASGLDAERDKVQIVPVPGAGEPGVSFGVAAAKALEADQIDAFWANAMATEIAIRRSVGKVLLDVRRGDGPPAARNFTFSGLVTTDALVDRDPERIAATVRALVKTHKALRSDPTRAAEVGKRRFPPDTAELIAAIIERDLPFYDAAISEQAVNGLNVSLNRLAYSLNRCPTSRWWLSSSAISGGCEIARELERSQSLERPRTRRSRLMLDSVRMDHEILLSELRRTP